MQRDLDALTALVGEDVDWPDGDERLHGRAAVRNYWSHQWARIHTQDKVAGITDLAPDRAAVRISRVIRDSSPQASSSTPTSSRTGWSKYGPAEALTSRTNRRTEHMVNNDALVRQLYEGFNRRDIPAVLALLAENVDWANGMDGGHVHGREAVRAYWTKQWAAIAPQVDPMHVSQRDDGATAVEVHQVVRDLEGKVLLDETVRHVFQIDKGLVTRFDIEKAGGLSAIAHD